MESAEELISRHFDWFEYIVFSIMLALSTFIGIFFCCSKGGQHTITEYYLGDKQMPVFPIAMSLIASSVSGITLLGQPSEIYYHGAQFALANVANILIYVVNITVYLPVFYNLQVVCLYEYLEMRYNHNVRVLASFLYTIALLLYIPVVIYGPALAFNQVSGLSVHIVAPVLCLVCIFYTTVGGLKAVVWADALQGTVMIFALIIVLVSGLIKVGGFGEVFSAAYNSQRLEVFDLNPDPTERITFWSSTIGLTFLWLAYGATNPAMVQRFIALPSLQAAKRSALFQCIGICTFSLLSCFLGFVIYAKYQQCDPLSSDMIKRPDQILPFFVLEVVGHIKGLPGIFVAGIVCAALSTMSTGINTLAGTCYEDFIEPIIGKQPERTASNYMKVISVIIGVLCTALVNVVERMGNIIDISSKFGGVTCGAILGIFSMGLLIPQTNSKGAFYGGLLTGILMLWTMVGNELSSAPECIPKKPLSVSGCANQNLTVVQASCPTISDEFKLAFPTYNVTVFYYGVMGFIISLVFGVIISYATGANDPADVNPDLLSPVIRPFLPKQKTKYNSVPLKENGDTKNSEKKNGAPIILNLT